MVELPGVLLERAEGVVVVKTVVLRTAYAFDCEDCGRENFGRSLALECSPEEEEELRLNHGIDPWDTGNWVQRPDKVTCQFCGAEFETEEDLEGEDD